MTTNKNKILNIIAEDLTTYLNFYCDKKFDKFAVSKYIVRVNKKYRCYKIVIHAKVLIDKNLYYDYVKNGIYMNSLGFMSDARTYICFNHTLDITNDLIQKYDTDYSYFQQALLSRCKYIAELADEYVNQKYYGIVKKHFSIYSRN